MAESRKLIIIGSGPAGLTAAIYAARAGLQPLVLAGYEPGGQLMRTTVIENYPGFPEGIEGPALMDNFMAQAKKFGSEIINVDVSKVDLAGEIKKVTTAEDVEYEAPAVIIATGATPRRLDIPGEDEFYGRGVSTCATCDGALFKDKTIAVIGGGDSAMEDANFLTRFAAKVYIIHRRDQFRASKIMVDRTVANPKIEVVWNTEVKEVVGNDGRLDHLRLYNTSDNTESDLEIDGMFLAIGHIPVTGYLNGVALTDAGYIMSEDGIRTNVEGVFVAGDVEDDVFRQAVTAAGLGCQAAMSAEKWLAAKGK
jgi:thioredoxin reductase (NADPH)